MKKIPTMFVRDRGFKPKPFWQCVPDAVDAKRLAVLSAEVRP